MLDEVKQVGNMAQAAARPAQPYRRHIVGLPLQRSLFGQTARAATTIGLPSLSSERDFPAKSAGAELMQNTFALYQACCDLNYTPQRLQREWPSVSPEVFQLVSEFCNRQTGFGPLAWDSPGYEDPNYVVRLLYSAFHEV